MKLAGLICALLLSGCTVTHHGVVHHVIIGFGVVSVPLTNSAAAIAIRTQALGLHTSSAPGPVFNLGYVSSTLIAVQDGATNVVVETRATPGSFTFKTQ